MSDTRIAEIDEKIRKLQERASELYRERISELEVALQEIGAFAHANSTGPAVPDEFWSIRDMAYRPLETYEQTDERIKREVAAEL